MTVVGTVGHIDHGKTVLLRALTGIDADRLPEERRRGITIDVGYAQLPLPDGGSLDFVDLPGHRDLAGNLLVGAGEMDAALLVVAGDSGPEAQTLEHLDVLSALGIRHGVVAVTKLDLVDADRRRLVLDEIGELMAGTALDGARVVGVSGRTGDGLDDLRAALVALDQAVRDASPPRTRAGHARLPVDRAFNARGHGVVATGTLRGGGVALGDELRLVPGRGRVRIRGIQVHGRDVQSAAPGGRVALNVAGDAGALRRGVVLSANPGVVATDRLLVSVDLVRDAHRHSRLPVALHIATDHAAAALRWVDEPTAEMRRRAALLDVERPIAAALGDRFLLRAPSPPRVLGGGTVLDPAPPRLRTRQLRERLASATPDAALATLLRYRRALPAAELAAGAAALGTSTDLEELLPGTGRAGPLVLAPGLEAELVAEALARVSAAPAGTLTLAELRTLLATRLRRIGSVVQADAEPAARELAERMVDGGRVVVRGAVVLDATGSETARLDEAERRLVAALDTVRPPALGDTAETVSYPREALGALVDAGRLVRVAPDLAFAASAYRRLEGQALDMAARGELSAAAFRDAVGTSRRHAVAVLDHMTLRGLLRRRGNDHEPGPRAPERSTDGDGRAVAGHGGSR